MYESSDSQFFRITTGIQLGPDAFDESRFIMAFLTILVVIEICSFRLVLKEKAGKEIPKSSRLEFLEKFLANNFALSEAEDNTSGQLNSPENQVSGKSWILLFGSFKNPFAMITSLSEFYFY